MVAGPCSERVVRCDPPPAARAKEEDAECVGALTGSSLPLLRRGGYLSTLSYGGRSARPRFLLADGGT
jgi:hypothetical protein